MKAWLLRPVHISWFIAWFCLGVLIGIALCLVANTLYFAQPVWLIVAAGLIFGVLAKRARWALIIVCLAGTIFGLWRGSVIQQDLSAYKKYFGKTVVISGSVSQDTSYGPQGDQRLRVSNVRIENLDYAGEVWVSAASVADIKRGDYVVFEGTMSEGFGSLAASMYRAEVLAVKRPAVGDLGRVVRDWFAAGVRKTISEPEASLGLGYLLGQKSALPELLEKQIQTIGLTHVVVASGYNLTILVAITRRLFARFSKYLATFMGGSMILGFMLITGFSPSMTRAGFVAGLSLAAWYYGRQLHPFVLLPFAAAITAFIKPTYVWGDIGWYLSFTAFFGVLVLAPLLHSYFWGEENSPGIVRELLVGTFSAQLMTLPIILLTFGTYSMYSLIANILILPLVPVSMLATFVAGIGGFLGQGLGELLSIPADWLLRYAIVTIDKVSSLPNSQSELSFSGMYLVLSYIFIAFFVRYLMHATKHNFRAQKSLID
jgi:competence protein ComEC